MRPLTLDEPVELVPTLDPEPAALRASAYAERRAAEAGGLPITNNVLLNFQPELFSGDYKDKNEPGIRWPEKFPYGDDADRRAHSC